MRTLLLLSATLVACDRPEPEPVPRPASPAAAEPTSEDLPRDELDGLRPVYPDDVAPDPRAEALCAALHDVPAKRRAACCDFAGPGYLGTSECVRTLSAALGDGAVVLDQGAADACVNAMHARYATCDRVGALGGELPAACVGWLSGVRAKGATCRSNLECAAGLVCRGVGPMDVGRCTPPARERALCGTAVDPLVTYTRQPARDACEGYCRKTRCVRHRAVGEACESSVACGPAAHCGGGVCRAGARAALGGACGGGDCPDGQRCLAGTCRAPKPAGATCEHDQECRAACVDGVCGQRCRAPGTPKGIRRAPAGTVR